MASHLRQGVFFALFLFVLTTYLISEKAGDLYSSRRPGWWAEAFVKFPAVKICARQQLDYWGGCTMQAGAEKSGQDITEIPDPQTLMKVSMQTQSPEFCNTQATTRHCKVNAWNPVIANSGSRKRSSYSLTLTLTLQDVKDIPSLLSWLENDFVPLAPGPPERGSLADEIVKLGLASESPLKGDLVKVVKLRPLPIAPSILQWSCRGLGYLCIYVIRTLFLKLFCSKDDDTWSCLDFCGISWVQVHFSVPSAGAKAQFFSFQLCDLNVIGRRTEPCTGPRATLVTLKPPCWLGPFGCGRSECSIARPCCSWGCFATRVVQSRLKQWQWWSINQVFFFSSRIAIFHSFGKHLSFFLFHTFFVPYELLIQFCSASLRQPSGCFQACSIIDDLQGIVSDCFADFSEPVQSRLSWAPAGTMDHLKARDELKARVERVERFVALLWDPPTFLLVCLFWLADPC